jgi:hypothetical protein
MTDQQDDPITHGVYGEGALDEVTDPEGSARAAVAGDADQRSTLPAETDLDELRDGGPTRSGGAVTTTGGTAGPASFHRPTNADTGGKVAPTTTGDAGSGGMTYPASGPTSDATTDSVMGTENTGDER